MALVLPNADPRRQPHIPLPGPLRKLAWEQRGAVMTAKRKGARVLHVPYLGAPLFAGLPVVVTAHDMIPWVVPGYGGSAPVRLYLALAAASARRARLIIADSEASRRDVIKVLKVPPSKVHTVYLGTASHPEYPAQELEAVRARHNLPADYSFYLGGFDRRKNVPLLLRAWRSALDALGAARQSGDGPLLVIGGDVPQPGGVFPDVRAEAARLGFGDGAGVRFLGRVSEEDKPLLMAAARLFVYPSAYEGFGLDPLEAMSVGCPVVSSSGGSLKEVVGDACLLVMPNDENALCDAIVHAWQDDTLRERLSAQGRERARDFTWQRTARQTWDLYLKAMSPGAEDQQHE